MKAPRGSVDLDRVFSGVVEASMLVAAHAEGGAYPLDRAEMTARALAGVLREFMEGSERQSRKESKGKAISGEAKRKASEREMRIQSKVIH